MSETVEEVSVPLYEITFTLQELQELRESLKLNQMNISWGVRSFLSTRPEDKKIWFWVEWADKIKMNENAPEEKFAEMANSATNHVCFTAHPPKA